MNIARVTSPFGTQMQSQNIVHEYSKSYLPFWDTNAVTKSISFCNTISGLFAIETFTGQGV